MINPAQKLVSFLKYWYFRYTLVTELYMVEEWERNFIHICFLALFLLFFMFNYTIVLPVTQYVRS
ncbi:uncharacterized protein LOC109860070 [Pseudomyrmex gracilis]|uniref:uncharacterized protein LOC109860070 n=1 Tax=Pseudomyrmex gracilis TaxID=219809 RepID=UPI000995AFD0|nr:uncharacterized protein LOC109860070 [Pseudomyrmex gracilis]